MPSSVLSCGRSWRLYFILRRIGPTYRGRAATPGGTGNNAGFSVILIASAYDSDSAAAVPVGGSQEATKIDGTLASFAATRAAYSSYAITTAGCFSVVVGLAMMISA